MEITERLLLVLVVLALFVLAMGLLAYVVSRWRSADLGDRWLRAAGSRAGAARALEAYELETDAMIVRGMYRVPAGTLVRNDRESVERLLGRNGDGGGGPGL